jgi:hypothetical protein
MASGDPIRIFVAHAWQEYDDYLRLFEYLESARNFVYVNCSKPGWTAAAGAPVDAARDELRLQIGRSEAVIVFASQLIEHKELMQFELSCAKGMSKPVILLPTFGKAVAVPAAFKGLWDEEAEWDGRAIIDAIKRQARHQESTRWDSIDFKMD